MATDYTRQWIQFFTACGIPGDVAATYSLIFNENRIQKNMLLDLNKEYLRDMGITIMGDIIAILRHAKVVHDKYIRDQILSESEITFEKYSVAEPAVQKSISMKRILECSTQKYDNSKRIVPHEKVQIQIENDKTAVMKVSNKICPQNKIPIKKKIEAPSIESDDLIPVKSTLPIPKVMRVLPQNEGRCNIKVPPVTTDINTKIVEKAKLKKNKTVFERLGESYVSSTSDVTTNCSTATQILKPSAANERNISSVFARLGEKSSLVSSTSTSSNSIVGDELPYKGILKTKAGKKLESLQGSTMRADNESQKAQTNDIKLKKINLKEWLGKRAPPNSPKNNIKLNRLQITTTFEDEEIEPPKVKTLSTRFKSIKTIQGNKNVSECLASLRPEAVQNKQSVSSTTQFGGIKRRLDTMEPFASENSGMVQSKKVRFGGTTQRLIPGNPPDLKEATKEYPNLTMIIGNQIKGNKKLHKLTLTSGVEMAPTNRYKIKQKSIKERIESRSLQPKLGRVATEIIRKRSLKFANTLKKNPISIHDRLG